MPSPAITRLDAAKASTVAQTPDSVTIEGTTATANVATSTNPAQNAAATAATSVTANQESVAAAANVIEGAKQLAAFSAVDHHILPHHKVIGVGSGSTVPYVVDRIVQQGPEANQGRFQSKELIVKAGLTLGDVDQFPEIDVTIDGADEVDEDLNCIKGGGACHLREKVLAEAAETWVVVADYRKNSRVLGTTYKQGVPIEVAPFAYAKLLQNVHRLGSEKAVLRMAKAKAGPVVTDNGNFVIDAPFDETSYKNPRSILEHIKLLTGVVEVGLFCGMAKAAYFGNQARILKLILS
ncbi:ribose-5-phosphate isomerase rki1 [Serendipita sp. 399]|nr:ribose-5-phosphate isomerase rki1 [Serendipita sp. 399]